MTVGDLIAELKSFDQNSEVMVALDEKFHTIHTVVQPINPGPVALNAFSPDYLARQASGSPRPRPQDEVTGFPGFPLGS